MGRRRRRVGRPAPQTQTSGWRGLRAASQSMRYPALMRANASTVYCGAVRESRPGGSFQTTTSAGTLAMRAPWDNQRSHSS